MGPGYPTSKALRSLGDVLAAHFSFLGVRGVVPFEHSWSCTSLRSSAAHGRTVEERRETLREHQYGPEGHRGYLR